MTSDSNHRRHGGMSAPCLCRSEVLAALARILDYSPSQEVSHHGRVAVLAVRMAERLEKVNAEAVFHAALIHDIGAPRNETDPPHSGNLREQGNHPLLRSHPLVGAQITAGVAGLRGVAPIILDHHEWVNGHGYPRGRSGDEIGPAAQVLRFADTCDMVLREQTSPELVAFIHAVESQTQGQVISQVAHIGAEVLGDPDFYAQLFTPQDVDLLVAGAIERLDGNDTADSEAEVTGLLELFGHLTDAHPADKVGHSRRVASLAVLVATAMGLSEDETIRLKWAALVHDIGLVGIPKSLLDKPGLLDPQELAEVRRHSAMTEEFLRPIHGLEEVTRIAAAHGEAYDGSGYPKGLSDRQIPLGARILAVCDTFDALTSRRPYREARDTSLAVDILVKGSGGVFDPGVVESAIPVFLIASAAETLEPAAT